MILRLNVKYTILPFVVVACHQLSNPLIASFFSVPSVHANISRPISCGTSAENTTSAFSLSVDPQTRPV